MAASFVECSNVQNVRNDRIAFEHSNNQTFKHSANAADKAVRAQGGAVVKPHQVKAMILAARRAYMKLKSCNVEKLKSSSNLSTLQPFNFSTLPSFDAWRRATLHDVVGAAAPSSFRAVTQRDYARVVAYFLELAGEECSNVRNVRNDRIAFEHSNNQTFKHSPKAADERRRALWTLNLVEGEVAEEFGGREGARRYSDALFAKIHKTDRLSATARQVWAVIFTLRNRAA